MLKMLFPNGLKKVLTLSYDDGCYDDIRLMELMEKYGIKGTFNVSSRLYRPEGTAPEGGWPRLTMSEALESYTKHGVEIAVHGLCHRDFTALDNAELNYEISCDRANLEMQYGCVVRGAAYPYGSYNDAAVEALKRNNIKYCRTVNCREDFAMPEDWLRLKATCHHNHPDLMGLAKRFIEESPRGCTMFYLWGHTAEFRRDKSWGIIEEFFEYMSGREDLWYASNIDICEYDLAYKSLEYSTDPDSRMVYNPTAKEIWLAEVVSAGKERVFSVKPGQTLKY